MKIRWNYVSNSSSSSFIILGNGLRGLFIKNFDNKNIMEDSCDDYELGVGFKELYDECTTDKNKIISHLSAVVFCLIYRDKSLSTPYFSFNCETEDILSLPEDVLDGIKAKHEDDSYRSKYAQSKEMAELIYEKLSKEYEDVLFAEFADDDDDPGCWMEHYFMLELGDLIPELKVLGLSNH